MLRVTLNLCTFRNIQTIWMHEITCRKEDKWACLRNKIVLIINIYVTVGSIFCIYNLYKN